MRKYLTTVVGLPLKAVKKDVPDIVVITGVRSKTMPIPRRERKLCQVLIIEFTYTSEHPDALRAAYQKKTDKYQPLLDALVRIGYPRPTLSIMVAGVRGWHPHITSRNLANLPGFKLSVIDVRRVMKEWTHAAWFFAAALGRTRRFWENHDTYKYRAGTYRWRELRAMSQHINKLETWDAMAGPDPMEAASDSD